MWIIIRCSSKPGVAQDSNKFTSVHVHYSRMYIQIWFVALLSLKVQILLHVLFFVLLLLLVWLLLLMVVLLFQMLLLLLVMLVVSVFPSFFFT